MKNLVHAMMNLIASEVCGKMLNKSQYEFTDDELVSLYKLSKAHDLAHLVGDALIKNELIKNKEIKSEFQKQTMLAFYRYEKINYELNHLCKTLNEAGIPFILLKGSVIRQYYPEPWMRTSCDIDILVHNDQVDKAAQIIIDKLGYTYKMKNYHDISLVSGNNVHLELHYSIKENWCNLDGLLADCWNYVTVLDGYDNQFTDEFFLFHQLAHMSYHFLHGGCGVRPFLDIYLLERRISFDHAILDGMLVRTGIKTFYEEASRLAGIWFGGDDYNNVALHMEQFILSGGVYGNTENSMAIGQQKEKGQLGYIIKRIWLPYEFLCVTYPKLRERRCLQLFYEMKRWFRVFDSEARK